METFSIIADNDDEGRDISKFAFQFTKPLHLKNYLLLTRPCLIKWLWVVCANWLLASQ